MLPQAIPGGMVRGNASGYQPWWNCKNSVDKINGESGCYPHDYDYGDNEDATCDPDTGVGCECEDALPPDSDFVCEPTIDPDTGKSVKIKRHKDDRARKFGKRLVKSDFNPKRGRFGVKKPSDCDWNPFSNPPYFLFCIILKILKPLFSPFMMLELEESSLLEFPESGPALLPDPRMYADTNGNLALLSDVTQYPTHSSLLLELSSSSARESSTEQSSSSPSHSFQDVFTDPKGRDKYDRAFEALEKHVKDRNQIKELSNLADEAAADFESVVRKEISTGRDDLTSTPSSSSSRFQQVEMSQEITSRLRGKSTKYPRPRPRYGKWEWFPGDGPGGLAGKDKNMDDKTKQLFQKLDKIVGDGKQPIDQKKIMDLVEEEAGETIPEDLRPAMPGQEADEASGNGAASDNSGSGKPSITHSLRSSITPFNRTSLHSIEHRYESQLLNKTWRESLWSSELSRKRFDSFR